jgi:DNA uptake protein ComE-like DNA-binding protein
MRIVLLATAALMIALSGCTTSKQDPDTLKKKTAEATAELKSNAKAVAEGVREGLTRDTAVELNTAGKQQLMTLPGIDERLADSIISARPYGEPGELVTRKIMSQEEYQRIKEHVTVKKR